MNHSNEHTYSVQIYYKLLPKKKKKKKTKRKFPFRKMLEHWPKIEVENTLCAHASFAIAFRLSLKSGQMLHVWISFVSVRKELCVWGRDFVAFSSIFPHFSLPEVRKIKNNWFKIITFAISLNLTQIMLQKSFFSSNDNCYEFIAIEWRLFNCFSKNLLILRTHFRLILSVSFFSPFDADKSCLNRFRKNDSITWNQHP